MIGDAAFSIPHIWAFQFNIIFVQILLVATVNLVVMMAYANGIGTNGFRMVRIVKLYIVVRCCYNVSEIICTFDLNNYNSKEEQ